MGDVFSGLANDIPARIDCQRRIGVGDEDVTVPASRGIYELFQKLVA
jgi:hypothetical protein